MKRTSRHVNGVRRSRAARPGERDRSISIAFDRFRFRSISIAFDRFRSLSIDFDRFRSISIAFDRFRSNSIEFDRIRSNSIDRRWRARRLRIDRTIDWASESLSRCHPSRARPRVLTAGRASTDVARTVRYAHRCDGTLRVLTAAALLTALAAQGGRVADVEQVGTV